MDLLLVDAVYDNMGDIVAPRFVDESDSLETVWKHLNRLETNGIILI
jgi:hypothetical protein